MVTIPPEPGSPSLEPHRARHVAESFGADGGRYDRTRPRYPQALADRVMGSSPGTEVLDVGIGSGVSALAFRARRCRILGVEPDERMAALARQRGFQVEVARFEDWDPAGRAFDAVISGQAWHWVDPVAGAAKAAALLRPGGRIAVFWNVSQPPADLAEAFSAAYQEVLPGSPFSHAAASAMYAYSSVFDRALLGLREAGLFCEPQRWEFGWQRAYSKDEWLEQVPTFGGHNNFPPGKLDELLARTGAAIDAVGGHFTMAYTSVVLTAEMQSGAA
jgi:SAM-dependent methyltransferase